MTDLVLYKNNIVQIICLFAQASSLIVEVHCILVVCPLIMLMWQSGPCWKQIVRRKKKKQVIW